MLKRTGLAAVLLLSAASYAQAADMASPMVSYGEQFDWTGWFIAGHAGFGSSDATGVAVAGNPNADFPMTFSPDGALGGLSTGYNIQSGDWVFGVELSWLGGKLEDTKVGSVNGVTFTPTIDNIFTVGPRIGFAVDNIHFYGEAGFASGDIDVSAFGGGNTLEADNKRANGYFVGAGIEYALDENWILGAEYNHIELKDVTLDVVQNPGNIPGQTGINDLSVDTITAKIAFKFN